MLLTRLQDAVVRLDAKTGNEDTANTSSHDVAMLQTSLATLDAASTRYLDGKISKIVRGMLPDMARQDVVLAQF